MQNTGVRSLEDLAALPRCQAESRKVLSALHAAGEAERQRLQQALAAEGAHEGPSTTPVSKSASCLHPEQVLHDLRAKHAEAYDAAQASSKDMAQLLTALHRLCSLIGTSQLPLECNEVSEASALRTLQLLQQHVKSP